MGGQDFSELYNQRRAGDIVEAIDRAFADAPGFQSAANRAPHEYAERIENAKHVLSFGVHFLDAIFGGIKRHDLVLIGARTGGGKTELATLIATANAKRKKRVHYLALEAERNEIERRIRFKIMCRLIEKDKSISVALREQVSFTDWELGMLGDWIVPYDLEAGRLVESQLSTLYTLYPSDFEVDTLEATIRGLRNETDLIVLDHLHYLDITNESENQGMLRIVKTLRKTALEIGRPVVAVAHLRKGDVLSGPLVPVLEDFHGSSNIPKNATKAIMLAAAFDFKGEKPHLWPTFMRPVKFRADGARANYVGLVDYDQSMGQYADKFIVGRLRSGDSQFEPVAKADMAYWLRRHFEDDSAPSRATEVQR